MTPRLPPRDKPARRRTWGALLAALLIAVPLLTPTGVRLVVQHAERAHLAREERGRALRAYFLSTPLPALPAPTARQVRAFAGQLPALVDALGPVSPARRAALVERVWADYRHGWRLLGEAQAGAWLRLLTLELRDQRGPARSYFHSPEAALASSARWLALIHAALNAPGGGRLPDPAFLDALAASSPALMAPQQVAAHARAIVRAGHETHLPAAVLAAIVDNEQAGAQLGYGLSGGVRALAAEVAQARADSPHGSGWWRHLSHNVGLTQMSWEDAELQGPRLQALGLEGVPVPGSELRARLLLANPELNVLYAAVRLRGYLNAQSGAPANSARPYDDAWVYVIGPGWHNHPDLVQAGAVWNYTWNGFFKAALYQRLLPGWARAQER